MKTQPGMVILWTGKAKNRVILWKGKGADLGEAVAGDVGWEELGDLGREAGITEIDEQGKEIEG